MSSNKLFRYHHFPPLHVTFSLLIVYFCCLMFSISSINAFRSIFNNGTGRVDDSEVGALLAWKASLDKQSRLILASWQPNDSPCGGDWSGISCNSAGRVAGIDLYSYGLRGTLHDFNFGSFTHLMNITLGKNSLSGTIPSNISMLSKLVYFDVEFNHFSGTIPVDICLLTNLEHLSLFHNNIVGTIPVEIGRLISMNHLDLSDNALTGEIPDSIGNLSELTHLELAENELVGFIPSSIENLLKLEKFYLYENRINGSIPQGIGRLTSLFDIELSYNKLSGPIPSSIGNLVKLRILYIFENELSGSIPETIGSLTSLICLGLSTNKLSGSIPSSIGNLVKLDILSLLNNHFTGEIPHQFNNLIHLTVLQLGNNSLTGSLPDNVCLGGKLRNFTAGHNELTGRLPRSVKNCTTLHRFRLEMNRLTGDLSVDLGIYPHLDYVDLSHNKFYGELSTNWGQCKSLTSLSISNNEISGRLPENLGEASQIQRLHLGSNNLTGEIPESFRYLTSLIDLKLDGNKLSGGVPKEFRMISGLSFLNLGANNLSGIIPEELGECRQLLSLNLSCNAFDGNIPLQLGNILHLQNLDLSYNKLSGEIPEELAHLKILESLNLSHNDISGFIPSSLENCVSLTSIDVSNNELEGPLPNVPAFQNASIDSLRNNKGLCGHVDGLIPCSSVVRDESRKKNYKVVIWIAVFVGLFVFIFVIGLFFGIRKWRKPRTMEHSINPTEDVLTMWSFDGKMVYENIIEATGNFDPQNCIGQGGYGMVFRAELQTGQVVAVKRLHNSEGDLLRSRIDKSFKSEIRALIELRHRNIVRLFGFCSHIRNSFLVYKFVDGDNLLDILKNHEQVKNFGWVNRLKVVKGVVDALSYMHHEVSPPLVHRDISSKNIMVDEDFEAHVTDFGTARFVHQNSSNWTSFAGTFGYSAPELAYTQEISEKCDVYSFGVLTLEVLMGTHPGNLISSILSSSSTSTSMVLLKDIIDQRVSPPVKDEIEKVILVTRMALACLQQNPQARPRMQDVSVQLAKSKPTNAGLSFSSIKIGELLELGFPM